MTTPLAGKEYRLRLAIHFEQKKGESFRVMTSLPSVMVREVEERNSSWAVSEAMHQS
jgi:hypothetical protein